MARVGKVELIVKGQEGTFLGDEGLYNLFLVVFTWYRWLSKLSKT